VVLEVLDEFGNVGLVYEYLLCFMGVMG